MKQCPNCQLYWDNDLTRCPQCSETLPSNEASSEDADEGVFVNYNLEHQSRSYKSKLMEKQS